MDFLNQYEAPILHAIQDAIGCPALDGFFSAITKLGDSGIFWIVLSIVLFVFKKTRKAGLAMAFSLIIGLVVCNLTLKPLIARTRPYIFDPSMTLIIPPESEFSFPSGHTVSSIEAAFALMLNHKKWGIGAMVLAVLIAFSRLYLMVHYPTDVIAGIIIAIGIGFVANKLAELVVKKTRLPVA
ncbi:MAG: phosphatase PAP2 family protein [Clostridia bacterium]|nr:phosphatase PAP2 family protein [Clostridia bacterium]